MVVFFVTSSFFLHTAASSSPQDLENEGLFLIQGHARKIVRSKASRVDFFLPVRLETSNVEQRFLGMGDWRVSRRVCSFHFLVLGKQQKHMLSHGGKCKNYDISAIC